MVPHLAGLAVERVSAAGRSVHVLARTCASGTACTGCGVVSRRVHSSYQRQLVDTASGGREVVIDLQARRFFCGSPAPAWPSRACSTRTCPTCGSDGTTAATAPNGCTRSCATAATGAACAGSLPSCAATPPSRRRRQHRRQGRWPAGSSPRPPSSPAMTASRSPRSPPAVKN